MAMPNAKVDIRSMALGVLCISVVSTPIIRITSTTALGGITVCKPWKTFVTFLADILAEIGERPPGLTLDRVNTNGNYEPGNTRRASMAGNSPRDMTTVGRRQPRISSSSKQ